MKPQLGIGGWMILLSIAALGACGGGGGGGGGGGAAATTGTIQFRQTSYDSTEGTVVNILVARTGGSSGAASVDYTTADGSAVAGADYAAASGSLTWPDTGSGNRTISIPLTDDSEPEPPESFTVTLSNVSGASLGAASTTTVNVMDDDGTAQLPITPDNAQDITGYVLEGISSVFDLIEVAEILDLPIPDLPIPKPGPDASGDWPFAKAAKRHFGHKGFVTLQATIVDTVDCDTGSATVIWDDADNNLQISTGDTVDVSFENCFFFDEGVTLTGDASITDIEITGDVVNAIPPWSLSATFTFNELEGVESNETVVIDGGFGLDFSTIDGITTEAAISGTSLTVVSNGMTETLSDFNLTQVIDVNAQTVTADANGSLSSTELNGTVEFETLASFVIIADDNPSAGQLFISDDSSSVLATVLDNISVRLEVDEDGDGTAETTLVVTWDDLDID